MPGQTSDTARRTILARPLDWVKPFNVEELRDNPPLIEKLHEEKQFALIDAANFEAQLNATRNELYRLRLKNQKLSQFLEEASRRSSVAFGLSLMAILLIGFGINVFSGEPRSWVGLVLIGGGCVAEVFAFVLKPGRIDP